MEEPKQDIKAQDTCALCLEKFRRDAKIYICPKCGCTLHEKCLVQYLTEYNFNRCFCMSCNRFFPNEEMKEHLKPMKYKEYVKKQIDTFNEQFMLQTMTKTNDLLFYYEKMRKINKQLLGVSFYRSEEFKMLIYFIHHFNPIDLKTFVESKGLTYQDTDDVQIEEKSDSTKDLETSDSDELETKPITSIANVQTRYKYEEIWHFQEGLIKQVHQWNGNPFQIKLNSIPFPYSFGTIWASCIYKVLYLDAFDPEFKRLVDEFQDMPNEFIPNIIDNIHDEDIYDIDKKVKEHEPALETKPTAFMMCSECRGLVVCINKHVYCSECRQEYCYDCGEKKTFEDGRCTHECNEETRKSFKTVRMNTHSCPKCGVRIQRSEGCDHMFCTACHTSFNWASGRIITVNVHNPHREEWLRSLGRSTEVTLFDVLHEMDDVQRDECGPVYINFIVEANIPSMVRSFQSLINYLGNEIENNSDRRTRLFLDKYISNRKKAIDEDHTRTKKMYEDRSKKELQDHLIILYGYDRLYNEIQEYVEIGRELIRQVIKLCGLDNVPRYQYNETVRRNITQQSLKIREKNHEQLETINTVIYQMTVSLFKSIECLCKDTVKTVILQKLFDIRYFHDYIENMLGHWLSKGNLIDPVFQYFIYHGSVYDRAYNKKDKDWVD